jgi:phosphoribosylanthranilate isomerase
VKIKICGITSVEDARAAVESGADAIGFVFVRSSPRYITSDRAATIVASIPSSVLPVGVFVDESSVVISQVIGQSGIRVVQLHGNEVPAQAGGLGVPVIKAHRIKEGFDLSRLGPYRVHAHLLDAWVDGVAGGTGKLCDWSLAARAAECYRIILSGGLTPENVAAAVGCVRPVAVDVSSGVELRKGVKDHKKMHAFIREAHEAFARLPKRSYE